MVIVELDTNFTDIEKNLLKNYQDVDVKLYIDLSKLVERFSRIDKESGVIDDKIITKNALEFSEMIPNRIIGIDSMWFVERKNELGSWYMGARSVDGTIDTFCKYVNLEEALKAM